MKSVLQNHILFWSLILLFHIIFYVLERIFEKEYEIKSWQLMIKLKMRNYDRILTETKQKYQHYHPEKLINMIILQVKKYYHLIEENNGTNKVYLFSFRKAFEEKIKTIEEQRKKSVQALEVLKPV